MNLYFKKIKVTMRCDAHNGVRTKVNWNALDQRSRKKPMVNLGYITNFLGFIGLYKFHAKSNFSYVHTKIHEFRVMVNMNDICTYSIF
jgi:hypothetical protein